MEHENYGALVKKLRIDNNLPIPSDDILAKVAQIAAIHSKAKNSSNVILAPTHNFFIVIIFGLLLLPYIKSNIVDGVKLEFKHKFVKLVLFSKTNSLILFLIASSKFTNYLLRNIVSNYKKDMRLLSYGVS